MQILCASLAFLKFFGYFWIENVQKCFKIHFQSIATFVSFLKWYGTWTYTKNCGLYKTFCESSCNEISRFLPNFEKKISVTFQKMLYEIHIFRSKFMYYTILESWNIGQLKSEAIFELVTIRIFKFEVLWKVNLCPMRAMVVLTQSCPVSTIFIL